MRVRYPRVPVPMGKIAILSWAASSKEPSAPVGLPWRRRAPDTASRKIRRWPAGAPPCRGPSPGGATLLGWAASSEEPSAPPGLPWRRRVSKDAMICGCSLVHPSSNPLQFKFQFDQTNLLLLSMFNFSSVASSGKQNCDFGLAIFLSISYSVMSFFSILG
jgi:hypothetical protein